jgi:hypothetical protein
VVALAAYALVTYVPAHVWAAAAPYWLIVVFCAFAIFGNQGWFQLAIRRAMPTPLSHARKILGAGELPHARPRS